jgi:hypothetical protein
MAARNRVATYNNPKMLYGVPSPKVRGVWELYLPRPFRAVARNLLGFFLLLIFLGRWILHHFGGWILDHGGCGRDAGQHRIKKLLLFQELFFGGRSLLMTIVMIVVARTAANLGGLRIQQRNHRMIRYTAALDTKIVYYVAEARVTHATVVSI